MSDLVGNPEDRFSHVAAHILSDSLNSQFDNEFDPKKMGNRVDRPLEERNKIISTYLNDLYNDKVKIKRDMEEVNDITAAVMELMEKITSKLGEISAKFKVSRCELVGSMKEGTSIGDSDEFDVQLVLEALSVKDGVRLIQVCEDRPGYAHIKIIDDDIAEIWSDTMENNELKSTRDRSGYYKNLYSIRDDFHKHHLEAVYSLRQDPAHVVNKESGNLEIYSNSVDKHGPAFKGYFRWFGKARNKLYIDIDIVPVIEFSEANTEVINNDCLSQLLHEHKIVMAVPCIKLSSCMKGLCFKLAFTPVEVELVTGLEEHHNKCYMMLKYLYNGYKDQSKNRYIVYHSYALKTLVLRHAKSCERQLGEETTLAECVQDLIDTTIECLKAKKVPHWWYNDFELNIPSIFFDTQSIYEKLIHPLYGRPCYGVVKKSLEAIGYMSEYKYEKCHVTRAFRVPYQ